MTGKGRTLQLNFAPVNGRNRCFPRIDRRHSKVWISMTQPPLNWLFAQATLNVAPAMRDDLQITESVSNIAVSITALFSGILLSSRAAWRIIGPREADQYRSRPQHLGSLLITLSPAGTAMFFDGWVRCPRISAGYVIPATLALMKANFDGKERQRALSFWSIGSWGGSGLSSLSPKLTSSSRWLFPERYRRGGSDSPAHLSRAKYPP